MPVQNIQGNVDGEKNNDFIDSASDEESVCTENTNSISYIAKNVERIDELNFDDSDISIVDDDQDVFI